MKLHIGAFAALLTVLAPAAHACDFCQKRVNLSQAVAQCYLALYEAEIGDLQASGLPAQLINLTACDGVEGVSRSNASVAVPRSNEIKVTKSFLLDEQGLLCLAKDVRSASWPQNDGDAVVMTFEVKRECG